MSPAWFCSESSHSQCLLSLEMDSMLHFCYCLKELAERVWVGRGFSFCFFFLFGYVLFPFSIGVSASISSLWATEIYLQNMFLNPLNTKKFKQWEMVSLLGMWKLFCHKHTAQKCSFPVVFMACCLLLSPMTLQLQTCSMHLLSSLAIFLFCFIAWLTKRLGLLLVFRDCISLLHLLLFSGELNCFYTSDERLLQFLGQTMFPNIWSARKEAGECWIILGEKDHTAV